MSTALSIRGLTVRFPGDPPVTAVDGIDLDLDAGEIVALVGESGCGKSTTANAVMGLLERNSVQAESIRLGDTELMRLDEGRYRRLRGSKVSMVFQEPLMSLDPVFTIGSQVAAVLRRHGMARRGRARGAAQAALERAGLGDAAQVMRRYPHQLSGGMRQRVVIAMALACDPKVLIADEPTTALDVTTQAQVLEELSKLGREQGTAILLITHDLGVASLIADRIAVMRAGRFVEMAATADLFRSPANPYTAELLAAVPSLQRRPDPPGRAPGGKLIQLEHRSVSHPVRARGRRGRLVAVNDVSLEIRSGEILGLVGESGCGKSTLAHSLVGLKPAEHGVMRYRDEPVDGGVSSHWREVRRHVQLVFQDPRSSLSPRRTVGQSLCEPLDHFAIGTPHERPQRVARALQHVGLEPALALRYPFELSGGQRQRVALARALIAEPDLIVADEPLSSLDVTAQARIIRLLRGLRDELGFAVLMVSHDLAVIRQLADRVAVMYLGRIVECGPADEVFERPAHPYTRALLQAVPEPGRVGGSGQTSASAPPGEPPSLLTPPPGCVFHTRCPEVMARCSQIEPKEQRLSGDGKFHHAVSCLLYDKKR